MKRSDEPDDRPAAPQPMDPMPPRGPAAPNDNVKLKLLEPFREDPTDRGFTSDQGIPVPHTDDSLKSGARGPTILEDFHFREKMTRFDHERIPERVVHARGSGAHGTFQVYESMEDVTRAAFLCDPSLRTPVFVRFSTVVGSRGSTDLPRDVRGFATKFYTPEGNFDLVGNNIPVFFIQDGIKFPDLVHAVKPEPAHEMPQAASAHDTFWDFMSLVPETTHMVFWLMSDRAIPRSYRMMEGFGVHTFRLVNAAGRATLAKFHWKPLLGAHSIVWDEAQKISGKDPDFHRRDLWNAIESGMGPEYELGVQLMDEDDQLAYGFDLLDATKLVPEELVPVRRVGRLVLDRNPQNFFAETEQVAFHVGNVVPGIDFTNDPLLQARLFSYVDTQLTRLGGPNFAEIPINRPIVGIHNHQQDGFHRTTINTGKANYHPNSIGGGCPFLHTEIGYRHYEERVDGHKIRARSDSFLDHFSQATLFFRSQSPAEQRHIVDAFRFELGKVQRKEIRMRVLGVLAEVDRGLAEAVSTAIGVPVPPARSPAPAGTAEPNFRAKNGGVEIAPSLSLDQQPKRSIRTRKVALFVAPGFTEADATMLRSALMNRGAVVDVVSIVLGPVRSAEGTTLEADKTFWLAHSVFYDALCVPGGAEATAALLADRQALEWMRDAFAHFKPIAVAGEAVQLLRAAVPQLDVGADRAPPGVVAGGEATEGFAMAFVEAIARHRHWDRQVD